MSASPERSWIGRAADGARRPGRVLLLAALACVAGVSCASWRPVATFDRWTLYADGEREVDPGAYRRAFDPALVAVEDALGPFRKKIRVYAWDGGEGARSAAREQILGGEDGRGVGRDLVPEVGTGRGGVEGQVRGGDAGERDGRGQILAGEGGPVQDVPGIGPARVRAFHARGDGLFGSPAGVYLGSAEPGTAVHELVHARLAEEGLELPLWLEEGLACFLGDGMLDHGRWVVDGLACWPLRELSEQRFSDSALEGLLALRAERAASVRDNVLAHFLGWAVVFDLRREAGRFDWREWCARYGKGIAVAEARERLERTVSDKTALDWMQRLSDPRPETRLAAAKGVWKLRSPLVLAAVIDALEKEKEPEAKVGLAINALAAAGEVRIAEPLSGRLWRAVWPALRRSELPNPVEQAAVGELLRSFRYGRKDSAQGPLKTLSRFWAE